MATDGPAGSPQILSFLIVGQRVQVSCDSSVADVILKNYGSLVAQAGKRPSDLTYVIARNSKPDAFSIVREEQPAIATSGMGDLLFRLEKDVIVTLQHRRPDLLFVHAAALECNGKAYLLAGESGSGKSTTAWGLLHHGFRYLSDELSPIDLDSLSVYPYSHALCLKQPPPANYPLPATGVLDLGATVHVPVASLPAADAPGPHELGGVLFVRYRAAPGEADLRVIGPAEAGARLYATTLNALAHPGYGLDAVLRIARHVPCFFLDATELRVTCKTVSKVILSRATGLSPERQFKPPHMADIRRRVTGPIRP